MAHLIDRILAAYRPLYLHGLLMDGQYRLPQPPTPVPSSGRKVIHLLPVFDPGCRRTLVLPADQPVAAAVCEAGHGLAAD